jgi:DNA-binding MarR family transcriptional regulator
MPKTTALLVDGLFQLSFLLQDRLARIAAAHELSPIQVRLLGSLRDRQPGMNDLARHLQLEKSSLSGLIDRAEKRGLVERIASKNDRRAATVKLTARGVKLAKTIAEQVGAEVAKVVAGLPEAEQKRLAKLVEKITAIEREEAA